MAGSMLGGNSTVGVVAPQGFDFDQLAQQVAQQAVPMIFSMLSAQPRLAAQSAGPQLTPQGFDFGQLAQQVAQQAVPMIFSMLSAQPRLAAQSAAPQLAPQGLFGNILGGIAPQLGGAIGGALGQQALGQQLGGLAGQFSHLLPFAAAPQLTAQGFDFGQLAQQVAQQAVPMIFSMLSAQPRLAPQSVGIA